MTTIFITARDDKSLYVPGIFEYLNTKINEYYSWHKVSLNFFVLNRPDYYFFYLTRVETNKKCLQVSCRNKNIGTKNI